MKSCFLCGPNGRGDRLERHHQHIFGGARRPLSEKYGLVVYLCGSRCHREGKYSVHQNAEVMDYVHKYGQKLAQEKYGWTVEQFREIFGASYIDDV